MTTGTTLMARVAREGWRPARGGTQAEDSTGTLLLFVLGNDDQPPRQVLAGLLRLQATGGVVVTRLERDISVPEEDAATGEPLMTLLERRLSDASGRDVHLSPRQADCLLLLAQGFRVREIADRLGVSQSAVEQYLRAARDRLGARSRAEAVVRALRMGLLMGSTQTSLPAFRKSVHVVTQGDAGLEPDDDVIPSQRDVGRPDQEDSSP